VDDPRAGAPTTRAKPSVDSAAASAVAKPEPLPAPALTRLGGVSPAPSEMVLRGRSSPRPVAAASLEPAAMDMSPLSAYCQRRGFQPTAMSPDPGADSNDVFVVDGQEVAMRPRGVRGRQVTVRRPPRQLPPTPPLASPAGRRPLSSVEQLLSPVPRRLPSTPRSLSAVFSPASEFDMSSTHV
jgi:hypothetical protein